MILAGILTVGTVLCVFTVRHWLKVRRQAEIEATSYEGIDWDRKR